ncbi:hypothetical protein, partial [Escherichia coli]|uniref:hypothetical protein n=1 Tax=Escherichia coli TaxID=562 RepID=UPI001112FCCE
MTTGSAVIASGNNATADVELEQSSFTSNGDMIIGQGTGTTTTLTLNNKSQVNAQGAMSVAKGDGAHATLDYTSSELTSGSAVIASGSNA